MSLELSLVLLRSVLERRHVIEQAEILEHDADAAAQGGQRVLAQAADVMTEQADEAAAGLERDEQQAQQRALSRARRAGEELQRVGLDAKGQVPQDFGPQAIAQRSEER